MGDSRRFDVFASYVGRHFPDRDQRIADVAGGKGYLAAALYHLGYRRVVTFDKRRNRANPARGHYRYQFFGPAVRDEFDLVLGMHPDGGTDEAMDWAIQRGVPFAVVPCCAIPSRWTYWGAKGDYLAWVAHLERRARQLGCDVVEEVLPIIGANRVIRSAA